MPRRARQPSYPTNATAAAHKARQEQEAAQRSPAALARAAVEALRRALADTRPASERDALEAFVEAVEDEVSCWKMRLEELSDE